MIGPNEAFVVGCAAGVMFATAFRWFSIMDERAREARATLHPVAPDPQRSAAGRAGAAVTNAKRRSAAELHRQRVLEVAAQMRRDMAAKKGEPSQ